MLYVRRLDSNNYLDIFQTNFNYVAQGNNHICAATVGLSLHCFVIRPDTLLSKSSGISIMNANRHLLIQDFPERRLMHSNKEIH